VSPISQFREALSLAEASKSNGVLDEARGHLARALAMLKQIDKAEVAALPDTDELKNRVRALVEALRG
jgi:hypothetical protein